MDFSEMNLYHDSEDEEQLMKLPETQREEILYKRYIKLKKLEEKKEMEERIGELEERTIVKEEKAETVEEEPLTYENLCGMLMKRDFLVKNIYRPSLSKLVGNYVRIAFSTGYVIRKVEKVERSKEYEIDLRGKKIKTDKVIHVYQTKKILEPCKFSFISNSDPDYSEYETFKEETRGIPVLQLTKKAESFKHLMKKEMTSEENKAIGEERSRFFNNKRKNLMRKIELIREREDAFKMGDKQKFKEIQNKIDKIDELDKDPKEEKEKEIWSRINERNRQINYEKSIKASQEKERAARDYDVYNPFRRR